MSKLEMLLETGGAAHELRVSSEHIRRLADAGVLKPVGRTTAGTRLFKAAEVQRLKKERANK